MAILLGNASANAAIDNPVLNVRTHRRLKRAPIVNRRSAFPQQLGVHWRVASAKTVMLPDIISVSCSSTWPEPAAGRYRTNSAVLATASDTVSSASLRDEVRHPLLPWCHASDQIISGRHVQFEGQFQDNAAISWSLDGCAVQLSALPGHCMCRVHNSALHE